MSKRVAPKAANLAFGDEQRAMIQLLLDHDVLNCTDGTQLVRSLLWLELDRRAREYGFKPGSKSDR